MLADVRAFHRDRKRRARRGHAPIEVGYNLIELGSTFIRFFETALVPRLLQTAGYASRICTEVAGLNAQLDGGLNAQLDGGTNGQLDGGRLGQRPDQLDVEAAVAVQMQRQQLLYDPGKRFEFLLAEPVLHWLPCPPGVMRGQLDRLQTIIGVPNVRFGILPLGVELGTAPQNSFGLYDDVAVTETFVGETTHRGVEAAAYATVMDRLWTEAVTGPEARRLLVRASAGARR
jgi:hypothetical protein